MARINLGRVVGRSAYEEAVRLGFVGTPEEWLESLKGRDAYELAVDEEHFVGTLEEWLESLKGKTAYENALEGGFVGSEHYFNQCLSSIGEISAVLDSINGEVV